MSDAAFSLGRTPARAGVRGPDLNTRPHFAGVVVWRDDPGLAAARRAHPHAAGCPTPDQPTPGDRP